MSLAVSELFGPTIQGEGPAAGRRAVFVRLGRCNLDCWWCDSRYTWDEGSYDLTAELTEMEPRAVVTGVLDRGARLTVITGGEPLLQRRELVTVCMGLALRTEVHVETNGTIPPGPDLSRFVSLFVVSPKLPSARVTHRAVNPRALAEFAELARDGRAVLKIVCRDVRDVAEAAELADAHGFARGRTWVMPEGTTARQVTAGLRALAEPAVELGMNLSGRQHVLVWGNKRGH